ncbi:hypothetical protein ZWY2020_028252 [Hordeum vulgare]|nr:hypothetical protein ZWY2020_028252 [Hordeum vulgare]
MFSQAAPIREHDNEPATQDAIPGREHGGTQHGDTDPDKCIACELAYPWTPSRPDINKIGVLGVPHRSERRGWNRCVVLEQRVLAVPGNLSPVSSKAEKFPARPGFGTIGRRCRVRANHFLVQVADKEIYHYDVCTITTGQRYSRKLNERQVSSILKMACERPAQRESSVLEIVNRNYYGNDDYSKEFGMKVMNLLALVDARVLPAPRLKYHDSGREKVCNPSVGQWNMINKNGQWRINQLLGMSNVRISP